LLAKEERRGSLSQVLKAKRQALRVAPGMGAGIASPVWSIVEIVAPLDGTDNTGRVRAETGLKFKRGHSPPPVLRDCLECGKQNGMKLQNITASAPAAIPLFYVCERCGSQFTVPPPPFPFRR
jgi:hypothetical protein